MQEDKYFSLAHERGWKLNEANARIRKQIEILNHIRNYVQTLSINKEEIQIMLDIIDGKSYERA